ncbi:MAG TPA: hypothetical protein VK538_03865 [Solirubrobacteraceae bacterium]|nr:hypothetical protein [Solirubrobacteraceae bacterium]
MARTDFIFGSAAAIAITWFADSRRPAGGVSEGGTGIGASELVERPADEAAESMLAAPASCAGRGALPRAPGVALAVAGTAHASAHARMVIERRTRRA